MKKGLKEKIKENKKTILIILLTPFIPIMCIFLYNYYINSNLENNNVKKYTLDLYCRNELEEKCEFTTSKTDKLYKSIETEGKVTEVEIIKNIENTIGVMYKWLDSDNQINLEYYSLKNQQKTYLGRGNVFSYYRNYILYDNNGLKIYDDKENKNITLNLESKYEKYLIVATENNLIGIEYTNYETNENNSSSKIKNNGFYNIFTGKKMYENKYQYFKALNNNLIAAEEINLQPQPYPPEKYLLSLEEEKIILEKDAYSYYYIINKDENNYYIINEISNLYSDVDIYTKEAKIIEKRVPWGYYTFDNNKNLYIKENNTIKKYDISGNLLETIKNSNHELLGFINGDSYNINYQVYIENNKLKLKQMDNNNSIEILDWNDNYQFEVKFSTINKSLNKIIVALSFKDKEYCKPDCKTIYGIEYYYDMNTKKIETKDITGGFSYQMWD